MYDLIVIGGGPAGLTAMIYALRKRLNALMVTKDLGGKTNYRLALPWINEYQVIRGLEVVSKFRSELEYLDFARIIDETEKVTPNENGEGYLVFTKNGAQLETRTVIVASGTRQKRLNVPGERDMMMRGLCYSALSYAPLFIDRTVAVIGDGPLALRSAAELATIAQRVFLLMSNGEAIDSPLGQKLASSENVQIMEGFRVVGVECGASEPEATHEPGASQVKGEQFARCLSLQDAQGNISHLAVDGTFVELGLQANSQIVAGLVEVDIDGRIRVDSNNRTSAPGIFAAGDVTTVAGEQVLIAVGEGAKAALSAYDYLLPTL